MKFVATILVSLLGHHLSLADESSSRLGNLKGGRTLKGKANKAKANKAKAGKTCKGHKALEDADPVLLQVRRSDIV